MPAGAAQAFAAQQPPDAPGRRMPFRKRGGEDLVEIDPAYEAQRCPLRGGSVLALPGIYE